MTSVFKDPLWITSSILNTKGIWTGYHFITGVTLSVHESVNEQLTIPMVEGLRSINVSSAVALVVGEACRQLNLL